MAKDIPRWVRPHFQPALARSFLYWVIWLPEPELELQLSRERHGLPEGELPDLTVQSLEDPDWLAGFLGLGKAPAQLEKCRTGVVVRGHFADARDMFALQAGLAIVKAYCDLGALAVLDLVGMRWWSPGQLRGLAPDRPFQLNEHVELVWENDGEYLMNTRGLAKFARPELFSRSVAPDQVDSVGRQLGQMAEEMALGRQLSGSSLIPFPDDSGLEQPAHGLGPEMFRNASLEWKR